MVTRSPCAERRDGSEWEGISSRREGSSRGESLFRSAQTVDDLRDLTLLALSVTGGVGIKDLGSEFVDCSVLWYFLIELFPLNLLSLTVVSPESAEQVLEVLGSAGMHFIICLKPCLEREVSITHTHSSLSESNMPDQPGRSRAAGRSQCCQLLPGGLRGPGGQL